MAIWAGWYYINGLNMTMTKVSLSKPDAQIKFSPQDLQVINQYIRQHFAPRIKLGSCQDKAVRLSAQELRDISTEISREYAPTRSLTDAALVLLPIDPQHIHAYWTLTDTQMATLTNTVPPTNLTLRVYAQTQTPDPTPQPTTWFDVPVAITPAQRAVRLPETVTHKPSTRLYATLLADPTPDQHPVSTYLQSNTLEYVGTPLVAELTELNKSGSSSPHPYTNLLQH